jgi:energy-coupling factor transporter ATP-binding protein EcfA2
MPQDQNKYPKGSEWRKWDLHVHSPLSLLNNQYPKPGGQPDWDGFIGKLEATDLAVVGLSDYFTIAGYKKVKEQQAAGRLPNIRVLPNIEFRLDNVVYRTSSGKRLNLHVIFSDDVSIQDIEEHFLYDLTFYHEGNPQDKDERRKLKLSNLEAFGQQLIDENAAFQDGRSALEIGAMCAVVDHEKITDLLASDSRFKNKYLIVLALDFRIDWNGQDHGLRRGLIQKSDMVFTSNTESIQWHQGRPPYMEGVDAFIREFKTLKPAIHGSDAHSLDEIGWPCAKRGEQGHHCHQEQAPCELRYCWIKADPTFEGLRQLLYEPSERVRIQEADPTPVKSNYCLGRIQLNGCRVNPELSIAPTDLPLNSGLIAVTGSKGSGKTALVDLIAHCYSDRSSSNDSNSFVKRVADQASKLEITLSFIGGETFSKHLQDETFSEDRPITYIAQGELEQYIGETSDLDSYIQDLLFSSPQVKDSVSAYEFETQDGLLEDQLVQLKATTRDITGLEVSSSDEVLSRLEVEKKQTQAELEDLEKKIAIVAKSLTAPELEDARKQQETVVELGEKKKAVETCKALMGDVQGFAQQLELTNVKIGQINRLLKKLEIDGEIIPVPSFDQEQLKRLTVGLQTELKKVLLEIEGLAKKIRQLETGRQEHTNCLTKKAELQKKLAEIEAAIAEVGEKRGWISKLKETRDVAMGELLRLVLEKQAKYGEIIRSFGTEASEVLKDLSFVAEIQFEQERLIRDLREVVDNRVVEIEQGKGSSSVIDTLLILYREFAAGRSSVEKIEALVAELGRLADDFKGKTKKSQAIGPDNLYDCLYGSYLRVVPNVLYKRTPLNRLSLGQKATVLIKIYLAQGTNPIIIDSHDDHLDNEFIMEELVGAIRRAKSYRQVILASNNGNVVINSDADQIIIANHDRGKISYTSGAIEEPTIRRRALKVLEGGESAFKKRQQKYRIPA